MNINDFLLRTQEITNTNLELLKALNDSLYAKTDNINVTVNGDTYVIPSILCLENKINELTENFKNLVSAPKTGEAAFVFDGNTQQIQMKSFTNTPLPLNIGSDNKFYVERNDVLKDLLTPRPYVRFDAQSIPMDITEVRVKKIIPMTDTLKSLVNAAAGGDDVTSISYQLAHEIFHGDPQNVVEDVDYVEYDSLYRLPINERTEFGQYTIASILNHNIDENFIEHYTIQLNEPLTYYTDSGTIEHSMQVGDRLVSWDDNTMFTIEGMSFETRTISLAVGAGAYTELTVYNSDTQLDNSRLKFMSSTNEVTDRYLNVTLEEDPFVLIFVAPVNSLNVQAMWGTGYIVRTANMTTEIDDKTYYYDDYYTLFVNNLGDTLYGITAMFTNYLNNYTEEQYNALTQQHAPVIDTNNLVVTEINSHLNDSVPVQKIKNLYNQKIELKTKLENLTANSLSVGSKVSQLSFKDTSESGVQLKQQLKSINLDRAAVEKTLRAVVQEIADTASNSELPIENAKYHIRGWFDIDNFLSTNSIAEDVIKIEVQYRYKNVSKVTGNALSINGNYIYSDWNSMASEILQKTLVIENGQHTYQYMPVGNNENLPKYNQIDIPISQGENVDVRLRVVYALGYPWVKVASPWSEIVTMTFPDEYKEDIKVLDIISQNNDEVQQYSFRNILDGAGVTDHVNDRLQDQDLTYFHKPEHIASGFYTAERRVIPLKDKLSMLDTELTTLRDEVFGTNEDDISVYASVDDRAVLLAPFSTTSIYMPAYSQFLDQTQFGQKTVNIKITNTSTHNVKLFSMFPGDANVTLTTTAHSPFTASDYTRAIYNPDTQTYTQNQGVWMYVAADKDTADSDENTQNLHLQRLNQIMYFRMNNAFTADAFYYETNTEDPDSSKRDLLSWQKDYTTCACVQDPSSMGTEGRMYVYPNISNWDNICTSSGSSGVYSYYKIITPGSSLVIPVSVEYKLDNPSDTGTPISHVARTISFDIRTSLYKDPINYKLTFDASFNETANTASSMTSSTIGSRYIPIFDTK